MTQKIIKIGSSAGVTIPKKQLTDMGLKVGDEIEIDIRSPKAKLREFAGDLDKFMDTYDQDLKNLAQR